MIVFLLQLELASRADPLDTDKYYTGMLQMISQGVKSSSLMSLKRFIV